MVKNLLWTEGKNILAFSILFACIFMIFGVCVRHYFPTISYICYTVCFLIFLFILFCFYFFRNPTRTCFEACQDSSLLICPADGKIVDISEGDFEGYTQKISIFLSPIDVHVNWIPMNGKVMEINYKPGEFLAAYVPKSSILNERNDIILQDNQNRKILVRQIAGTIARRIVCWIKKDDYVDAGQKYGMIKFSSRIDILLPKNVSILVVLGQRVLGGQTVLGKWL